MIVYVTCLSKLNGTKITVICALLTKLHWVLFMLCLCSKSGQPDTHGVFEVAWFALCPTSFFSSISMASYRWIREQVNQFGFSWVLFTLIYSPACWPLQEKNMARLTSPSCCCVGLKRGWDVKYIDMESKSFWVWEGSTNKTTEQITPNSRKRLGCKVHWYGEEAFLSMRIARWNIIAYHHQLLWSYPWATERIGWPGLTLHNRKRGNNQP
jgi:hypothetical protein